MSQVEKHLLIIIHINNKFLIVNSKVLVSVVSISSYGAPLAQRASYLAQHSSLFVPDGTVNYDYIVTNSINSLLIGSRCIPNDVHTKHCCGPSKHIKISGAYAYVW